MVNEAKAPKGVRVAKAALAFHGGSVAIGSRAAILVTVAYLSGICALIAAAWRLLRDEAVPHQLKRSGAFRLLRADDEAGIPSRREEY